MNTVPWLLLTPNTIGWLGSLILCLSITMHLVTLKNKSGATWSLVAFFGGITLFAFLVFASYAWGILTPLSLLADYLLPVPLGFGMIGLGWFAYQFPYPLPQQRREAQFVFWVSVLVTGLEFAMALYQLYNLFAFQQGLAIMPVQYALVSIVSLGITFVFIRRTILLAENTLASFWQKLRRPQGKAAQAPRAFAGIILLFAIGFAISAFGVTGILPNAAVTSLQNLLMLVFLFGFLVVYLDYAPETSTFMVKLTSIGLITILTGLGFVAFYIAPTTATAYPMDKAITDQRTLHFEPAPSGGYTISMQPLQFDNEWGTPVTVGGQSAPVELGFAFPFYAHTWTAAQVDSGGFIVFSKTQTWVFRRGLVPGIAPLQLAIASLGVGGKVYYKTTATQATFTWDQIPEGNDVQHRSTFQLVLYPDGAFDLNYNGISAQMPHFVGTRSGNWGAASEYIWLGEADLPYSSQAVGGVSANYSLYSATKIHETLLPLAYLIIGTTLVILLGYPVFFRFSLIRPLTALVEGVDRVNAGDLTTNVPVQYNDEIGRLTQAFNAMVKSLDAANKLVRQQAQENARLEAELDVTHRLQQMLLPGENELRQLAGLDIAGFMQPAEQVGGDYYDVLQHGDQVKIGIGDVTGHGLESGVVMLMTQTAIRTLLAEGETDPVRFLDTLNRTLYANLQRMGVDKSITLTLLDYELGRLRLRASGQHEQVIIVRRGGQVELLDTLDLGFPLGMQADIARFVKEAAIDLKPGDGIVLYSDGITEAQNATGEFYGLEKLCAAISREWGQPAQAVKEAVLADVRAFIGTQTVYDDLALLVVKQK